MRIILIVMCLSATAGYAMEDDKQLAADMTALTVNSESKVDAWKALDQSQQFNIAMTLSLVQEKYDETAAQNHEKPRTQDKDDVVWARAYRDIRHAIRDGAPIPSTDEEFNAYLMPSIEWVGQHPDCTADDISNISDTSTEITEFNGDDDCGDDVWDVKKEDDGTTIMLIRKD